MSNWGGGGGWVRGSGNDRNSGSWNSSNDRGSWNKPNDTYGGKGGKRQGDRDGGWQKPGDRNAGSWSKPSDQQSGGWSKPSPSSTKPGPSSSVRPTSAPPSQPPPGAGSQSRATSASSASAGGAGKTPAFTANSNARKTDLGVETLLGDFAEEGSNHGRKVYKKMQTIRGHEHIKVFMYYWDTRDGADFSGWWFGDKVGGSNVWARCNSQANTPPQSGWKIPWNAAKAEPGILTVDPYKGQAGARQSGDAGGKGSGKPVVKQELGAKGSSKGSSAGGSNDARVQKASSRVDNLEKTSSAAVSRAKAITKASDPGALKRVQDALAEEQTKLNDAQRELTHECNEMRKTSPGPAAIDMQRLPPRLRTASTSVATELTRLKGLSPGVAVKQEQAGKVKGKGDGKAKGKGEEKPVSQEELKKQEEKNSKELKEALPAVEEAVKTATDLVDHVVAMAGPIESDPPEEVSETLQKVLDDIEQAANDAQKKLSETRQDVQAKLQTAQKYAAEARKKAIQEYGTHKDKLTEEQNRLNPFKNFKKQLVQRGEAKKALQDIVDKVSSAELEVEKASMMSAGVDKGAQMSEEDIESAKELVTPAETALANVSKLLENKLRGAAGAMKDELLAIKKRLKESQTKVDEIAAIVKVQKESLALQGFGEKAQEKLAKAEAAMEKCGEAELPFLKGIEVLPAEESEPAVKACEEAASEAKNLTKAASSFVSNKLSEAKRYSKEAAKNAIQELTDIQTKTDALLKRVTEFSKETQERKITGLMAEAIEVVQTAESKKKELDEIAKVFSPDNLSTATVEALKEAGEKASAAEKECTKALREARKMIGFKRKASKDKALEEGLGKLTNRANTVADELAKIKKVVSSGGTLVEAKEMAIKAEAKLPDIEADVEKLVKLANPDAEGLGVEEVSDEAIVEIDSLSGVTSASLKELSGLTRPFLSMDMGAGVKAILSKITDRIKSAQDKIEKTKSGTKETREKVLSVSYAKDCMKKSLEVDESLAKLTAAEDPYLKGIELSLEASTKSLAESEEAIAFVQSILSSTRTFFASKTVELKRFDPKYGKAGIGEIEKITENLNAAAKKLGAFKKDTALRKKKAQLQEAGEKVKAVETETAKLSEAMKPIMEKDAESLSQEEAAAAFKTLEDLEKAADEKVKESRNFLSERSKEARGDADATKEVKELEKKLQAAQGELDKAKKLSSSHNQKLMGKAVVQEASDKIKEMQAEMDKATAACAPLVDELGERFLVQASMSTLCTALRAHMEEKELSEEAMFKKMGEPLNKEAFVAFLAKLPEEYKRDECLFSEERRLAMFKSADADADGVVSLEEFKAMFRKRFVCIHGVTVTDIFEIKESKALSKLEVGEVLETTGESKPGDGSVPRLKVKVVSSGQEGWVTTQGNAGTKYLEPVSPFKEFVKAVEASLATSAKSIFFIRGFFKTSKCKQVSSASKGSPLLPSKEELDKLRSQANELASSFDKLKGKVDSEKKAYPTREAKEKRHHIQVREQKEADEVLAPTQPAMEGVESELKKIEDAAKPLTEADALMQFATPLAVQEEVKTIEAKLKTAVEGARNIIKGQQELAAKASKGPVKDAKERLQKMIRRTSEVLAIGTKLMGTVRSKCNTIASTNFELAAAAMRSDMLSKNLAPESLFKKLASDGDRISEAAFVSHLQGLADLKLPGEHAMLVAQKIEVGGIACRSFAKFIQLYYQVVQEIAITPNFSILGSKDQPVRKAEVDEVVEVLEGPKKDDKCGIERVKIKALKDGSEGWVTVQGNQGKTFLEEVEKPFFNCVKETALENDFKSGASAVRTLKEDEVLELLEGPRREIVGNVMRVKGKASDGKYGWFTVKDQNGNVVAEKDDKLWTCMSTVAITDNFDVKECKVLRKLVAGETFVVSEIPEESSGLSRVKGKISSDGVEGWITVKGNAGTVYAKVNEKLYTIRKETELEKGLKTGSASIRTLKVDEVVEVLEKEEPKEEKSAPLERVKVRASSDNSVGWITDRGGNVKPWRSSYKFSKASKLYASKGSKESVVREVKDGEVLELVEVPVEVEGKMWMKGRLKREGAVGWATMKDEEGEKLLVNM